jgi:hypothetical protein
MRLARLRAFLREHGGPRAPRTTQSDEDPVAAEACFRELGVYPSFDAAIADLYPDLYAKRLVPTEKRGDAGHVMARPYDPKGLYEEGEVILHPRFGQGEVMRDGQDGKVEILFASGSKTLICG